MGQARQRGFLGASAAGGAGAVHLQAGPAGPVQERPLPERSAPSGRPGLGLGEADASLLRSRQPRPACTAGRGPDSDPERSERPILDRG